MHVAVIALGNGIAEARALARSLARHQPAWPVTVLVLPGLRPELRIGDEPFTTLVPADLKASATLLQAAPQQALAVLMRPLLIAHLLDAGAESVLLLPSDAQVYAPLTAFESEHDVLLVPRLLGALPDDGARPDGHDLAEAGEIDDEVVAVRATEAGRAFVDWWADHASQAAETTERVLNPLAVASRVFPSLGRVEDPAYGVSYWNLHERALPPVLMRWAGFRPDRPWWLSKHATRTLVLDDPALTALVGERVQALRAGGWIRLDGLATGAGELPNGLRHDARLQTLLAQAADAGEHFGDVMFPATADAFTNWLREPAPAGGARGINRYVYDVWRERTDVQEAYPDLDGADADGFIGWLWVHGRPEMNLQAPLLPAPPEGLGTATRHVPPVLVAGYMRGNLGLGEAARGYVRALAHAGVPLATRSISADPPVDRQPRGVKRRPEERAFEDISLPQDVRPEINLLCVNADQTPALIEELDEPRGDYTIGVWGWETDLIPERWDTPFSLVDELWVYTSYVAENLARAGNVPVVVMPLPIEKPDPKGATVPFEVPDGFVFLFVFDFFSTLERKNPVGLVEAFKRAFAPGEGPTLLLKTINADFRPAERERLRYAIGDRPDIRMVDASLDPAQLAALFVRADSYVSLHRSEGFGLTLAESMALGKPVIATGFSGNTDFMTPTNSYLVHWTPTEVGPDAEHYPAEGTWAEPSLDHAAELMRAVYDDQDEAGRRGARAAEDVAVTLSVGEVARIAHARLLRIAALRVTEPEASGRVGDELAGRLHFDLSGGEKGGARGLARRGVFRALAPYSSAQRQLDVALVQALERAHVELEAERAAWARERLRSARRDVRTAELAERLAAVEQRLDRVGRLELPSVRAIAELRDAAHAIPFTEGDPFEVFEDPVAGRVLGFRHEASRPVGEEETYRAFEDVFRGTRERVRELATPYVDLLRDHAPVLDAGCGRGELLELLRDAGIEARGVDLDAGMAEEASALGLDVTVADALEYLEGLEDGSLGAVVSMQVIEHIPGAQLPRFFALGRAKLRAGGRFIAETVNPHAGHALKTFWVDLTHEHPVFPEVALALAGGAGYREAFITHLAGERDAEHDRFVQSSYAVVATV